MTEKRILTEETLQYGGLFDVRELYRLIDEFFETKSYDKAETEHRELVSREGKDIEIIYEPYKKVSDYFMIVQRIEIRMRDLTEVEVEIDKKRRRLKKGDITFVFKPMLYSDYEGKWEQRPLYYLVSTFMDKFIYRKHTHHFETMALKDMKEVKHKIGGFLNLFRYTARH